jgi:hypothetical protein
LNRWGHSPFVNSSLMKRFVCLLRICWAFRHESKVKVILRLTISESVSLGIEHPPGAHDQIFFSLIWKLLSCSIWAPSLTRGRVCHLSVIVRISKAICHELFQFLL